MGNCGEGPCGDIDRPPSRSNNSLFAIIELVIMGVVGIICLVDLFRLIQYMGDHKDWDVIEILRVIEYGLIVAGLVLIIIGIFCSPSQYQIRTGILCFCVGTILAVVILVLLINDDRTSDTLFFNICYMIFLIFLAYILWRQSSHL